MTHCTFSIKWGVCCRRPPATNTPNPDLKKGVCTFTVIDRIVRYNIIMAEIAMLNNRYQLEAPLGSGGMAVVYKAKDHMLERTVAIKVLREDYSRDTAFRERFHQEAKAAANLTHPNIVTVYDFGMDSGRLFIVMEYVEGTNLYSLLQSRGRLSVEESLPLIIQICAGIGFAHRSGLVHCDVKPHNFLITKDGRVKVTDFGIARALSSILPEERTDIVWGSPQYFSPEQAGGGAPSPASDVYSLGVVMYYMLTGRLPFTASSATELAQLHRSAVPLPPRHYNTSIPPNLEQIILKVLSKEPSQRYRTADQLGQVLKTLINAAPGRAAAVKPSSSSSTRPLTAGTVRPALASQPAPRVDTTETIPPFQPAMESIPVAANLVSQRPEPIYSESDFLDSGETSSTGSTFDFDWITMSLGLLALLSVGGLIPLYVMVFFSYFPPTP